MRYCFFFITVVLVFASISAIAQEKDIDPNGYNVFYYPGGQKSSEGYMKNGQPEGMWINYYPSGQIRSKGKRTDHELDSTWVFYDENGNLTKKIQYKNGKKHGYYNAYKAVEKEDSTQNILVSKELYFNDKLNGKSFYYDKEEGYLKYTYNYDKGKKHGLGKQYDESGKVINLFEYFNGFLVESSMVNRKNSSGGKTGKWLTFYPAGQIETETHYINGKKHGRYRKYDKAGNIIEEQKFRMGKRIVAEEEAEKLKAELKQTYYNNGNIKYEGAFIDSIPVGMHKSYEKDGSLDKAMEYNRQGDLEGEGVLTKQGLKDSVWTFYFPTKEPRCRGAFRNGKRHGKWEFYFQNGNAEQVGHYRKGKPHGEWKWYYPDGSLIKMENYHKGKLDGELLELSPEGDTIQHGSYVDGKKTGEWMYNVGDHKEVGNYEDGLKHGIWKHYYRGNTLIFEGEYVNGEPDGLHQHWYVNGEPELMGKYIMGKKDGLWQKYHRDGSLFIVYKYDHGELKKINGKNWEKWQKQFE
jgi:uncharacterized protein